MADAAESIPGCTADSSIGSYVTQDGQRIFCPVSGPGQFAQYAISLLLYLYHFVGGVGEFYVIGCALFAIVVGVRLTGTRAVQIERSRNGVVFDREFRPAVQGTATSGAGFLVGNILKIGGLLFFVLSVFSLAYHL